MNETIAKGAVNGGFIPASSKSMHPAVKPGNYRAMVQAGREFGAYPLDPRMLEEYRDRDYVARCR